MISVKEKVSTRIAVELCLRPRRDMAAMYCTCTYTCTGEIWRRCIVFVLVLCTCTCIVLVIVIVGTRDMTHDTSWPRFVSLPLKRGTATNAFPLRQNGPPLSQLYW